MTLDTRMIIASPMAVKPVFDFARTLIGADDSYTFELGTDASGRNKQYSMDPGQGLPGWLMMNYGADGPLGIYEDQTHDPADADGDEKFFVPLGFIQLSLDTGYSFQGKRGAGCTDLHSAFVAAMGLWLNAQRKDWWWYDEYRGQWHHQHEGLLDFGDVEIGWADLPGAPQFEDAQLGIESLKELESR